MGLHATPILWYVAYFASQVCVFPFQNAYFSQRGLDQRQIGLISALRPWISAPASFAWPALADRTNSHKAVLLFCLVSSKIIGTMLLFANGFGGFMAIVLIAEVLGNPVSIMADAVVVATCTKDTDYGKYRLWGAVGWGVFSFIAGAAIDTLGITSAFIMQLVLSVPCLHLGWALYKLKQQTQQSKQAGTAAQGSVEGQASSIHHHAPRNGPVNSRSEDGLELTVSRLSEVHNDSTVGGSGVVHHRAHDAKSLADGAGAEDALILTACSSDLDAAGAEDEMFTLDEEERVGLLREASHGLTSKAGAPDLSFWRKLQKLLKDPVILMFFWTATVMGFGFGTIESFLFIYLQELGGTETLMGLTLTITCAAEVPVFQLQGRVMDRVHVDTLLCFVMLTYSVRMLCYAVLPHWKTPWAVLPIEPLHGVTFALGWGAGTVNCKRLAPPGLEATMQGTFQSLYFGLGYGIGALLGGFVAQRHGISTTFVVGAAVETVNCVLIMLGHWLLGSWQQPHRPRGK